MKPATYKPNVRDSATAHQRGSSAADTSTVSTLTLGATTSAILLSVETTAARVTLDGTNPGAASAPSLVFQTGVSPVFIPVGAKTVVKWVSTAAAVSTVQIAELT